MQAYYVVHTTMHQKTTQRQHITQFSKQKFLLQKYILSNQSDLDETKIKMKPSFHFIILEHHIIALAEIYSQTRMEHGHVILNE